MENIAERQPFVRKESIIAGQEFPLNKSKAMHPGKLSHRVPL